MPTSGFDRVPELAQARQLLLHQLLIEAPASERKSAIELASGDAAELTEFCTQKRIVPLLAKALVDGIIRFPAEEWQAASSVMRQVAIVRLRCEAALLQLGEILEPAGVEFRVLKGLATGSLDYDTPTLRQVGDVDVLVPVPQRQEVFDLLQQEGLEIASGRRRWAPELEHAFTCRLGKVELDIHHRLLLRAPGHMVAGLDLFADPAAFELHGRLFFGLSERHRLLHAAGHLVTSPGIMRRWSSHADVLRLMHHADISAFDRHAGDLVSLGVDAACAAAGLSVSDHRRRSLICWAYGQEARTPMREHLLELVYAPPPWSVKNQISWVLGTGVSPMASLRKVRAKRSSGPMAEVAAFADESAPRTD